jgi:hypothetical protein
MGAGLSFGPQYGRLQGETPHNFNAFAAEEAAEEEDREEAAGKEAVVLEEMDKAQLLAYIRRHQL